MKFSVLLSTFFLALVLKASAQTTPDRYTQLQQNFVDLKFGMFIHFNIPTYADADWPDPQASPALFNPKKLNCDQWAKAAKSANMTYGCLTTKHHSGFCIWDTKTTDYNVMNSPLKKDVVKEYVDAFRKNNLKVMLYYSILDTHHMLRKGHITPNHFEMVKAQITELLTKYGKIEALIIDGWDAPWSRISYDDISFEDVYMLIKSLQPECVVMDLNGAKYPGEGLFYSDIKTYEMGAGQRISKETNRMPALACLPLQSSWFWKTNFPATAVKEPAKMVAELKSLNDVDCNFILNVAPNRDGVFDDNAIAALKEIGKQWSHGGPAPKLAPTGAPIISSNLAKNKPANSSWSDDMDISDFANDDDFQTSWRSSTTVAKPWYEVDFGKDIAFNAITLTEKAPNIKTFHAEYLQNGVWKPLAKNNNASRVKINRFDRVYGSKVRVWIDAADKQASIAELGVYNERR
ncbi:carbohydrate-binding protein [Mucilaginibacter pallidiroseus]|uniref:alpha-L-fucosidase n=1 Tax=Mucilaginibacter pallidiroseus TaxID=2599295 RepID=A0A563U3F8_9SPHI|nr:alpha-L-fucosidase [Mucilaginibacter pallidiroseus]TWR25881.1 carbohydrate-binding protein [Mucilaginibacter pallidiroseus]